ncbi:hypothetical protein [Winogradskyella sp. A3E31]|uniref:hypothetical protein n=1 Tax=Winogradskyella sp. A3E31 TaxID=3349637 RepID=UPI00398AA592
MKRIIVLMSALALVLTACTGDPGPPGPQGFNGLDGADGGLIVSGAFEITLDFTEANEYSFVEPYGFEVFPSDVTLVYIEWEVDGGEPIWRLLPQTVYFDEGILTYNFDFTQQDVRFFLDGTIDFSLLGPEWTDNQAFRVVVVPADNVDGIDVSDLNAVMELNGVQSFDIR